MSLPPVVVIHSSSPKRDYDVLVSVLPPRFQPEGCVGNASTNGSVTTSKSNTDSTTNRQAYTLFATETSILILPIPTIPGSITGADGNGSVKTGGSVTDDLEFENVPLTAAIGSKTYAKKCQNAPIASFANLTLDSQDELLSINKLLSGQNGLAMVEKTIKVNNNSGQTSSLSLTKFLLPGGCLVTLSTALCWKSRQGRRLTAAFMCAATPMATHPGSVSGSGSTSESQGMRRTLSLPDMVPPMVMTGTSVSGVRMPSLEAKVLSFSGNYEPFPLNAQTPVPIESDLFVGRLLIVCRPATDPAKSDPYWNERIFSKKKRRVVMQLQGKFKYKPTGTVFAGMEISDPMKLGLIANGLCNLILKLVKSFNPALHYSFGSKDENAHICFPASTFFETLIATPPGETPPAMGGIDFEGESSEAAAARKAYKTKIDYNTEDTYSMSFHSMYVDFPTWSIVSTPLGRDVSLQTFWGNSFARIVLYEVDKDRSETKPHLITSIKYILGAQLTSLGENGGAAIARSNAALLEQHDGGSEEDEVDDTSEWISEGGESTSTTQDTALMPPFDEDSEIEKVDDEGVDTALYYDTIESLPGSDGGADTASMDISSASSHNTLLSIIDRFCPCWIDMFSRRGKYVKIYAFCGTKSSIKPYFRSAEMAGQVFKGNREEDAEVDDRFSHRISTAERTRRILGLKYAEAHTIENDRNLNKTQLRMFHKTENRYDKEFLKGRKRTLPKVTGVVSAIVARALSDRHWKEERMVLTDESGDLLFHHVDGSSVHFRILLSNVINLSALGNRSENVPLPSYYYLQIESLVRVTTLMFSSEEERNSWLEILTRIRRDRSSKLYARDLFESEIPIDEYLSKSTMWNCQKRKILNLRRQSFRTPRTMLPEETLQLAERALTKVLTLKPKGTNDSDLREFLDCAAALKEADAHSLNDEEKCAFFLNIYHIMIMHSYIVLGPPVSGPEWISYFNNIAYQCSDDIFSLAELEHNIIRAQMSYPSNFLSRFVLPKSQYHFALVRSDFRLNFAMNSGSLSTPTSVVPVYKALILNEQLNNVTKQFVGYTVHVRQKGRNDVQISLPRVCQWFADDFGPNGSASDVVSAIEPFLSNEKRNAIRLIWNSRKKAFEVSMFGLKYLSFNYECRFLTSSVE